MLADSRQFAALVKVFRGGTKLTYRRGEYIIRPGETPSSVFYIEEGLVKALNISKYGEENLLIIRKSQEIFPLIWALTGQEREIIYQAITPTIVRRIDRQTYLKYLHGHPSAMPPILDMVTEMYRIHSERILNLEYRTVRERLISFLISTCHRLGEQTEEGMRINAPLRHQDIASSINASRETASRELAKLEQRGLIKTKQFYITLLDVPALQSLL
ncbi:MAG TPA: Crp/Fnr family transcriptional regulator [Candidatus Saccharimonadales bacterium]|nr:Crp/Fnr family transcriptional regulator [Candidatus Saccharimonadales bacterium]